MGYSIGLNGLSTARKLMEVAGDNISNANTDGYHAKRADVAALTGPVVDELQVGLGSTVQDIGLVRSIIIEDALLQHIQAKERLGKEVELFDGLESLFSELKEGGLDGHLGRLFDSIEELSADPADPTRREQVVQNAVALCDAFNRLDEGMSRMAKDLSDSMRSSVKTVNSLTEQIAYLNRQIEVVEAGGKTAAGHRNERYGLISQLAELVNVKVYETDSGAVNISTSGTLIVDGVDHTELAVEPGAAGSRVVVADNPDHTVDVREGRLGALLDLSAEKLPRYRETLDQLANDLRRAFNLVHTTSLGREGRFTSLQGENRFSGTTPFAQTGWGVEAGTSERLTVNVEDRTTGQITAFELALDTTQPTTDFLNDLRDAVNAGVDHVSAALDGGRISLQAEDGFAFGFASQYDPNPAAAGDITAADPASPSVLGNYSGERDLQYDVTFLDAGKIGTDPIDLRIDVREPGGGPVLRTIVRQIDDGYAPGDTVAVENGLQLTLGEGSVAAGDSFSFTAHASNDTAGVLDALGLNTMFGGRGAGAIHVVDRIVRDNSRLAGALTDAPADNQRFLDMAAVRRREVSGEGSVTLNDFYRNLATDISTTRNTKNSQHRSQEVLVKDLKNRRDAASGVNVDEEMVQLIQARTLYQGAMKYIRATDQFLADLAAMI